MNKNKTPIIFIVLSFLVISVILFFYPTNSVQSLTERALNIIYTSSNRKTIKDNDFSEDTFLSEVEDYHKYFTDQCYRTLIANNTFSAIDLLSDICKATFQFDSVTLESPWEEMKDLKYSAVVKAVDSDHHAHTFIFTGYIRFQKVRNTYFIDSLVCDSLADAQRELSNTV